MNLGSVCVLESGKVRTSLYQTVSFGFEVMYEEDLGVSLYQIIACFSQANFS